MIIARNLNLAHHNIQVQALELMRLKRIYTHTSMYATPKRFIFVALIPDTTPGPPFLTPHLVRAPNTLFAHS